MTDKEKAIVMAHTGICMLAGDKFQIFHKYVEDIMGRPIMTHEIGRLAYAIKEKSKADFLALCAGESGSENPNKWIPVSERLPEERGVYIVTEKVFSLDDREHKGRYNTMVEQVEYYNGKWRRANFFEVIAWMPLPEPYMSENPTGSEYESDRKGTE